MISDTNHLLDFLLAGGVITRTDGTPVYNVVGGSLGRGNIIGSAIKRGLVRLGTTGRVLLTPKGRTHARNLINV